MGPLAIVRENIEVDAPIDACYQAWSDFQNFPEFMSNVKDVRKVSESESIWVTRILGIRQEWRATMMHRETNRSLSWQASGDVGMNGRVTFSQVAPNRTRIDVEVEWKGDTLKEGVADVLGIDEATVKQDLKNFKDFIEGRKTARTGVRTATGGTSTGPRY